LHAVSHSDQIAGIDLKDTNLLAVIDRVRIGQDRLKIDIAPDRLSKAFGIVVKDLDPDHLTFESPFTLRRRGVETRLLLDGDTIPRDGTLLRNIAKGQVFLERITSGQRVQQIAEENDLSVKRVQQTLEFAFLSPDVVRQVVEGRQQASLTADWCLKHEIPVDWAEQTRGFRGV